jgi:PAS domain S-box-containing protein
VLGLALLAAIVILVVLEDRQAERDRLVTASLEVRSAIQSVEGLLVDAETGVRGFLLTGDPAFLEPYERAVAALTDEIDRLEELVSDNQLQTSRVDLVRRAAERRLAVSEELLTLDEGDQESRTRLLEFGRSLMVGIRADLARMEAEQDRLLDERTTDAEQTRAILTAFIPAAGLVGLIGLIATVTFATRVTRRVGRISDNAVRLGRGEPLAPMRLADDEIGRLGQALVEAAELLHIREEQLRSARASLDLLVVEGPVVMFRERLGKSHQLTYVSSNVERVLGVAESVAIEQERFFSSLLSPVDRERFNERARQAARGETDRWYDEYRTAANHGQERWVAVDVRVQRDEDGNPAFLLGYVLDITDRVTAAIAAGEAQDRYQQLFERIPTGMITTSADGRILDANPAMALVFGFESPDELIAEVPDISVLYHSKEERLRFLETVQRDGEVKDFEVKLRRRDGATIDVAINGRVVPGTEDGLPRLEGTAIDVTARRKAEDEARRAQAEADRANQAKSLFLSRMSHELRTPLNSILGFSQLLEISEPPLDARSRESVGQILKAGRHLLDLIDEVLDIAQVEAGRLRMSLEPVDTGEILAESIDLIRPLAAARNISMSAPVEDCSEHVLADRQRLKQVFLNLLSNAVKYNHRGGKVTVECSTTNGDLEIAFTDSGPGMTADQIGRLFTPFDRLGAENSGQQGTGLGLVLSRHLLEEMAGNMSVTSAPGEGSTFTISLPRIDPDQNDRLPGSDLAASNQGSITFPSLDPAPTRTVLYIEDNLANLHLIERIVALRSQINLEAAMQGRLGIDLARQHSPDLIMLDLNLPDMDGRDVLIELKADPATRHIPVIVISADASHGQIERLLDSGAAGYVTKPVNVVEILRRFDELLV